MGAAESDSVPTVDDGARLITPDIRNMLQGEENVNGQSDTQLSSGALTWDDYLRGGRDKYLLHPIPAA